jgi:hypothetical protein
MFPPFLKTKGFHEISNLCRSALPIKEQAQLVTNQHLNILKLWIQKQTPTYFIRSPDRYPVKDTKLYHIPFEVLHLHTDQLL